LGIFIDQALQLAGVTAKPAVNQWRRQMADGQSGNAALGLRRLARIADDERIDHRQRAGDDFGKAFGGERDGLARQPFQRAMCAHMHERIDLGDVLQPQAERDQRVARRQLRIVIIGAPLRGTSAIGRQRDQKLAEFFHPEAKRSIVHIGIVRGFAPSFVQPCDGGAW
jgi:hypothetical protein